jgi:cation diffusion facilitator family transporter
LLFLAILCTFFIVIEFTGGYFAHSIAIMTDAGHMLSDLLSTILSIVMIRLSSAKANRRFTFGYLRAEFVGALMSLFVIWVVTTIMVLLLVHKSFYDVKNKLSLYLQLKELCMEQWMLTQIL